MHRIQATNIKDTREAKGTQMLKVNGTMRSVDRFFRAGHVSPYLWQYDFTWNRERTSIVQRRCDRE